MELSTGMQNNQADAAADVFDGGVLEIRTGSPPGANAADAGTLLASISLPSPAYGSASNGAAAIAGTWEDEEADGTGTAAHFRLKASGDDGTDDGSQPRIEGTVGGPDSGADLELDNTSIAAGQAVAISAFPISQPASAS